MSGLGMGSCGLNPGVMVRDIIGLGLWLDKGVYNQLDPMSSRSPARSVPLDPREV